MSKDEPAERVIIIRKRHGRHDDHHHGGVWKIAYADFMTAMMAFFLVMWLINAANTETKASVASYFNPVKLTDSNSHKKGLRDPDAKPDASGNAKGAKAEQKTSSREKPGAPNPDQVKTAPTLFPHKSSQEVESDHGAEAGARSPNQSPRPDAANKAANFHRDLTLPFGLTHQGPSMPPVGGGKAEKERTGEARSASAGNKDVTERQEERARQLATQIRGAIEDIARQNPKTGGPGIEVTVEKQAIVVSLTDTNTFGMFAIGSWEPNAELVLLLQRIAPIISGKSDSLLVRGHTDARPYRAEAGNNNWKLSMARAEVAYAMLVKAGIDESRFQRIEAWADRKLKVPGDPQAAANRRIEILIWSRTP